MAEVGRWKPYTQRQGQLLPAFLEDARGVESRVAPFNLRRPRIRNRARLTHAGEAAPPARGAE